jgi:hypothetical protein
MNQLALKQGQREKESRKKGYQLKILYKHLELTLIAHEYNPGTWKTDVGGSRVTGQPGLRNETLSQIKLKNK